MSCSLRQAAKLSSLQQSTALYSGVCDFSPVQKLRKACDAILLVRSEGKEERSQVSTAQRKTPPQSTARHGSALHHRHPERLSTQDLATGHKMRFSAHDKAGLRCGHPPRMRCWRHGRGTPALGAEADRQAATPADLSTHAGLGQGTACRPTFTRVAIDLVPVSRAQPGHMQLCTGQNDSASIWTVQ